MKTTKSGLHHLQGMLAYQIYWEQYYQCRPRLSSIMAIDLNLEILVDEEDKLLAFRHDAPKDMGWMVMNAGHWQIVGIENLSPELLDEVRTLMVELKHEICLN